MQPASEILPQRTSVAGQAVATRDRWRLRDFRIIPRLETYPGLVAFAQTTAGRLALVALFTFLSIPLNPGSWLQIGIVLMLISLLPERRRVLLALAAICWVFLHPPLDLDLLLELARRRSAEAFTPAWPAVAAGILLGGGGYAWLVRRYPASPLGRRPVLGLLLALCLLLVAATALPVRGLAFFAVTASAMVLGKYLWFLAYAVSAASSRQPVSYWKQLGFLRPFWGFSNVPYGKGAAYLRRVEAAEPAQLATAQLKGLKLIVWSLVLMAIACGLDLLILRPPRAPGAGFPWGFHGLIPTYGDALTHQTEGRAFPLHLRWLALMLEFLRNLAALSIFGHTIIATARMAGFSAARNTYRPLTSTTIAEFYNRVYYYFKELLVDFFFYPTFFRYFKRYPRLRLFAATLAAASLGNFIYHFLRDDRFIFHFGFWPALKEFKVDAAYVAVLGTAIALSQLRTRGRGVHKIAGPRKALAIAGVLTFYCLITVLDPERVDRSRTLIERGGYFLSLFRP
jgi:hypothetical protein